MGMSACENSQSIGQEWIWAYTTTEPIVIPVSQICQANTKNHSVDIASHSYLSILDKFKQMDICIYHL